jgi:YD repeat-containing protein
VRLAPRGRRNLFAIVASLAIALASFSALSLAATVFYVYDELGRLVAEIDSAGDTTRYTYDPAGNLLSVTRDSSAEFRVDDFSPSSGRVGDSVTIFGAGFIANPAQNALSFNGTPATITLATAHSLVASVPSGAASGPITISNANGSAATVRAFTVIAPAAITTVSPSHLSRGRPRVSTSSDRISTRPPPSPSRSRASLPRSWLANRRASRLTSPSAARCLSAPTRSQ